MLLAPLLLQAAPMAAATPETCPSTPAALPAPLAGWGRMRPVRAATRADAAPLLPLGQSVRATLPPAGQVALAVPSKPAAAGSSSSGLFAFAVTAAGRYQVALDAGVWVDVVAGGVSLASVAHGHGPACSGIRKLVSFDLKPGRYLVQLVGSAASTVRLMIARS